MPYEENIPTTENQDANEKSKIHVRKGALIAVLFPIILAIWMTINIGCFLTLIMLGGFFSILNYVLAWVSFENKTIVYKDDDPKYNLFTWLKEKIK